MPKCHIPTRGNQKTSQTSQMYEATSRIETDIPIPSVRFTPQGVKVFVFCLCLVLFLVFVSLVLCVLFGFLDDRDSA